MDYIEKLLSLGFFAVASYIFSIFIKPQIDKLRELRNKFNNYKFTNVPRIGNFEEIEASSSKQKREIEILDNYLNSYKIEYQELERQKNQLRNMADATFLFLALFINLEIFKNNGLGSVEILAEILFLFFLITIFGLFISGLEALVPNSKKLSDWSFLTQKRGIDNGNLINAINFSIHYSENIQDEGEFTANTPIGILLSTNLEIRGYKYLFFIFDSNKKAVYQNVGVINEKTNIIKNKIETSAFNLLYYTTKIGDFPFNKISTQKLDAFLFIFDPCEPNRKCSPLYCKEKINFQEMGNGLISSFSSRLKISELITFDTIEYEGSGMKFSNLRWKKGNKFNLEKEFSSKIKKIIEENSHLLKKSNFQPLIIKGL